MTKLTNNYESQEVDPYFLGFCDILRLENDPLNVIIAYTHFICSGLIPPDNILLAVAKGFAEYLDAKSMSLEECFNIKPKQGVGSPTGHRAAHKWKAFACYLIWHQRKTEELAGKRKTSIIKAAEQLIEKFKIPHPDTPKSYFDTDTLARYYKAGWSKQLDRMHSLQLRHGRNDFDTKPKIYAEALKKEIQGD